MARTMNGGGSPGDVLDAGAYSVEELRRAVFEGGEPPSRPLALALLGHKTYADKERDMQRLLMDEDEVPRLRAMAAQILGDIGSAEAVDMLRQGLTVEHDVVLRGVIAGLRASGSDEARAAVRTLSRRRGTVGAAARHARALLEHQRAERGVELARVDELALLRVSPRQAVPIDITRARGKQVAEAVEAAQQAVPAVRLASEGAVSLRCGDDLFVLVLDERIAQDRAETVIAGKAQAGVVVRRRKLERKGWELAYHVLTRPRADGKVDVVVTTGSGRVRFAGTAQQKKTHVEFRLQAVARPGALAVDLAGTYEAGRLTFSRARSNVRRRPSPSPKARRSN